MKSPCVVTALMYANTVSLICKCTGLVWRMWRVFGPGQLAYRKLKTQISFK